MKTKSKDKVPKANNVTLVIQSPVITEKVYLDFSCLTSARCYLNPVATFADRKYTGYVDYYLNGTLRNTPTLSLLNLSMILEHLERNEELYTAGTNPS
jgi:hypothetical protein